MNKLMLGQRLKQRIDPAAILRAHHARAIGKIEGGDIRKRDIRKVQTNTLQAMSMAELGTIYAARPITPPHTADEIMRQRAADAALMEMTRRSRASPHPGWEVLNRQFR